MTTTAPAAAPRLKVLCVDDEPQVIDGLTLFLRRQYEVLRATSGAEAIEVLGHERDVAVIVSDMRMPGMDGATLLGKARRVAPDAVRILLTGQADLDAAMMAVNQGNIFRFLTKPCPAPRLLVEVGEAAALHRLASAERVLLEQTLHGCIRVITDVLALANPTLYGRANRLKQLVTEIAAVLDVPETWQLEVAAMLCNLGSVGLPAAVVDKLHQGRPLSAVETESLNRVTQVTEDLLAQIPRIEPVRQMLRISRQPQAATPAGNVDARVLLGARVLRAAMDYDALDSLGQIPLASMQLKAGEYEPAVLAAIATVEARRGTVGAGKPVRPAELRAGMTLTSDLRIASGVMVAPRGTQVTAALVERVRGYPEAAFREPITIIES